MEGWQQRQPIQKVIGKCVTKSRQHDAMVDEFVATATFLL